MNLDPDLLQSGPDLVLSDHQVYFVWQHTDPRRPPDAPVPTIPRGVLVRHRNPTSTRDCVIWVPWVRHPDDLPGASVWSLLSLRPLSIAEPFICQRCGEQGGIRDGRWWIGVGE